LLGADLVQGGGFFQKIGRRPKKNRILADFAWENRSETVQKHVFKEKTRLRETLFFKKIAPAARLLKISGSSLG
tara:strand:+ start:361 stop:582 length:222 start_codon:yes stop_codon:yes gene_type:complete